MEPGSEGKESSRTARTFPPCPFAGADGGTREPEEGEKGMAEQERYKKLTREELNQLAGEELSERAAVSLINANISAPVNAAVAANILFDDSVADANSERDEKKEAAVGGQRETEPGQEEQDEPGDKIRQAEPEEKAEKETTEDIDRAFD